MSTQKSDKRVGAAASEGKEYVTFTRSGVYVDLDRYLATKSGQASIRQVARAGDRVSGDHGTKQKK